jgi:hypothetical protein
MGDPSDGSDWLERDEFVRIGELPADAVAALWPWLALRDRSVWINPMHLRRHLQSRAAYLERIAFLNSEGPHLQTAFDRIVACMRYDKVPVGQYSATVVCRSADPVEHEELVVMGVRFFPSDARPRRAYVSTVYPWNHAKLLRVLRESPHWLNPLDKESTI